jgi:hypothetical protein
MHQIMATSSILYIICTYTHKESEGIGFMCTAAQATYLISHQQLSLPESCLHKLLQLNIDLHKATS